MTLSQLEAGLKRRAMAAFALEEGALAGFHLAAPPPHIDADVSIAWPIAAAKLLRKAETAGDYTARLALMEEAKTLPFSAVWDEYCRRQNAPVGSIWLDEVRAYERKVLSKRG